MRHQSHYFFRVILIAVIVLGFLGCGERTKATDKKGNKPYSVEKDSSSKGMSKGRLMLPDFSLQDLEGREYRLTEYVGKKPILLVFWTSACRFCIAEIPRLNKIYHTRSNELEILSINIFEPKRAVRRLAESRGIKYPVLLDSKGITARDYRIQGVPTVVVIDLKGSMGYYGHDLSQAMMKIDGLLS